MVTPHSAARSSSRRVKSDGLVEREGLDVTYSESATANERDEIAHTHFSIRVHLQDRTAANRSETGEMLEFALQHCDVSRSVEMTGMTATRGEARRRDIRWTYAVELEDTPTQRRQPRCWRS